MAVGIISCEMLAYEIKKIIVDKPEVTHLEVMNWRFHIKPKLLGETISQKIYALEEQVDAVMLAYGRCQSMNQLPQNFKVPVFYPEAEDCIGVLLGQKNYQQELLNEAKTWFLTPSWTELGMSMIFHELQMEGMAEKGYDPMIIAHRMLEDFTRILYIRMPGRNHSKLYSKATKIAREFDFKMEEHPGSENNLRRTLDATIAAATTLKNSSNKKRYHWGAKAVKSG